MTRSAKPLVRAGQRLDGLAELVFGKAAHLGDQLAQLAKLFVESLSRCDWTWDRQLFLVGTGISRSGR
jgi:hypothetical protein